MYKQISIQNLDYYYKYKDFSLFSFPAELQSMCTTSNVYH